MNRTGLAMCCFVLVGCTNTDEPEPEPKPALEARPPRTCTEVAPRIVHVHEEQLYMPGTRADKLANGGRYAMAAIDECTHREWPAEVRACLSDAPDVVADRYRSRVDACLRLLEPTQRASLAAALQRVEAELPGFTPPGSAMAWLAP